MMHLLPRLQYQDCGLKYMVPPSPGGEQQRVAIARALANDPNLILADEPTGNLDSETSESIINVLTRLVNDHNRTVILVTHDYNIAKYANRKITIRDGKLETEQGGTLEEEKRLDAEGADVDAGTEPVIS